MIRRPVKTIFTLSFLLTLLVLAVLRSNHWRMPAWIPLFQAQRSTSTPEDAIYSMLDAARAGDTREYLDAFSGPMHDQLLLLLKENSEAKFKSYLTTQNAAFQGVAIAVVDRPSSEEAQARVEYVFRDRNEIQNVYLKKAGSRWRIFKVTGSEQVQTLVPFGTAVSD